MASGGATLASDFGPAVAPTWQIDPNATPVFNRAFRDWHADFFATLKAAGMDAIVAFSQELVNAPDNPPSAVGYQRFWDQTPVRTDTGFQNLKKLPMRVFGCGAELRKARLRGHGITDGSSRPDCVASVRGNPSVVFDWYPDPDGSQHLRAWPFTMGTRNPRFSRLTGSFWQGFSPSKEPGDQSVRRCEFLAIALGHVCARNSGIHLGPASGGIVRTTVAFGCESPGNEAPELVREPAPELETKNGSGFSSFLCEGFQFGGVDRNVDGVHVARRIRSANWRGPQAIAVT